MLHLAKGARLLSAFPNCTHALLHLENLLNATVCGAGTLYGNAELYIGSYDPVDDRFNPVSPDGSRPRIIFGLCPQYHQLSCNGRVEDGGGGKKERREKEQRGAEILHAKMSGTRA